MTSNEYEPVSVPLAEAEPFTGIGRTTLFKEAKEKRLRTFTVGNRRLVTLDAIREWAADRERECNSEGAA